jgi:hypothetical protein
VSIIPRGVGALGYTMQRPTEDRFLLGRQELENRRADGRTRFGSADLRRRGVDRGGCVNCYIGDSAADLTLAADTAIASQGLPERSSAEQRRRRPAEPAQSSRAFRATR